MSVERLDEFRKKVEAQLEAEKKQRTPEDEAKAEEEISIDFVKQCFRSNEVGDSLLYNTIHKDKFVTNALAKDEWMQYVGPHWVIVCPDTTLKRGIWICRGRKPRAGGCPSFPRRSGYRSSAAKIPAMPSGKALTCVAG